ncbi:transcriptional regulator, partial [Actinomadura darangshiensis]|uniref:transcriptional regulator n=1 Tax=Actinomadura darangshiensis TaxID=705336 RepID=UPI00140A8EDF
ALDGGRGRLGEVADGLYPGTPRVAGTPLLCRDGWVPDVPVPLDDVRLEWEGRPGPPAVADPPDGLPDGYRTYAEAMAALAAPKVFEDRPSYRLLDAAPPVLRLGPARYFDGVNVGESVAHELAAGAGGLPLRTRIGDPCDLSRRTALPAITTATVTTSGRYVLHRRDPAKVAHAGGLYQVMPVGVFQPLDGEPPDMWRCMVREYAEELLGTDENYGDGFVQDGWPFHRTLTAARAENRIRAHFLGLGVDPLTFALDLLTVVAIDEDLFGELFGGLVAVNAEGEVSMAPFDGTVPRPMQPAGAAALTLAWRHRARLGLTRG